MFATKEFIKSTNSRILYDRGRLGITKYTAGHTSIHCKFNKMSFKMTGKTGI